jgi:hypothetical protein
VATERRGMNPTLAAGLGANATAAGLSVNNLYRQLGAENAESALGLAENAVPREITKIRAAQDALELAKGQAAQAAKLDRFRIPAAALGTVLTGVGLYQAGQPVQKTAMGMDLKFDSQQQAQDHLKHRDIGGALGMAAGAGLGARSGMRRFGTKGAIGGALLGAVVGNPAGRVATDVVHDLPDRTHRMHENTQGRMNAAGGIRIAAAAPTAEDFEMFAQLDETNEVDPDAPKPEVSMPPRTEARAWGAAGGLGGLSGLVPGLPPNPGV